MMIAGRFIAGIALGILTSTIPMFCAEISEKSYRGAMSGLLQWTLSWGFSRHNGLGMDVPSLMATFSVNPP